MGTLAQVSLSGGTPRQLLENVRNADWSPDGKELAVLRAAGDKLELEFPIGRVILKALPRFGEVRISPDGSRIAVTAEEGVRIIDRTGRESALLKDVQGTVWSPRGDEIWWLKTPPPSPYVQVQSSELHATSLRGRDRLLATLPGDYVLHDVSRDGRVLLERDEKSVEMVGTFPGRPERSLAWLDESVPSALSADGRLLLFADRGDAAGTGTAAYLRGTDGALAVRLGTGSPLALSPDGKWALVRRDKQLVLLPTGPGQERSISGAGIAVGGGWIGFHPDGRHIIARGVEPGHRERAYELTLDGTAAPRPLTPEGTRPALLSPDGRALLIQSSESDDLAVVSMSASDEAPPAAARLTGGGTPVHWNADGRSILVAMDSPIRIDRLELASGRRTLWRAFPEAGRLGMGGGTEIALTPNEDSWVVGYQRFFSELVVVEGVR